MGLSEVTYKELAVNIAIVGVILFMFLNCMCWITGMDLATYYIPGRAEEKCMEIKEKFNFHLVWKGELGCWGRDTKYSWHEIDVYDRKGWKSDMKYLEH